MIDFPTSPIVGQVHTIGTRSWAWLGSGWARLSNSGQNVAVFTVIGPVVQIYAGRFNGGTQIDAAFTLVNYV